MVMNMEKLEQIKVKLYVFLAVLLVIGACICIYHATVSREQQKQQAPTQMAEEPQADKAQGAERLQETGAVRVPETPSGESAEEVPAGYTIQPESAQTTYTLAVADGCLQVYVLETGQLYMETTIVYDLLPEEVRTQIDAGKHFDSEETLLEFLESYSS